jgi:hypothetical protein
MGTKKLALATTAHKILFREMNGVDVVDAEGYHFESGTDRTHGP